MRIQALWIGALTALIGGGLRAQDVGGNWQGTLGGAQSLRVVITIARADGGGWSASLMSIDQIGCDRPLPANSVTRQDSVLHMGFEPPLVVLASFTRATATSTRMV
jgi:hypothetical protein